MIQECRPRDDIGCRLAPDQMDKNNIKVFFSNLKVHGSIHLKSPAFVKEMGT